MRQTHRPNPRSTRPVETSSPGQASGRGRIAFLLVIVTICWIGGMIWSTDGRQILMPGPLSSAHVAIGECSACHTDTGKGKLSWMHGLVATNPLADSKACLDCHKMPDTAFNPHGASAAVLEKRSRQLADVAARTFPPLSARVQNSAFPMRAMVASGLNCAACHQEHKGMSFDLKQVSNQQCRGCHMVQFDSFDGTHPQFSDYPFKRRTRIIYNHASHFDKHFPEVAKKNPARQQPATCAACHSSNKDKRVMAVTSFDNTCTSCHLDQITGKERASGPKGIAFLSLPGLDLETLQQKNAGVGEWPEDSEAELTPFMKIMVSRTARGRDVINAVNGLDLQDLSKANDQQIKAVADLTWEIKSLFYDLIAGKASSVLADLKIGNLGKLSPALIGELTASIPRDVIMSAHQQWLPRLGIEIAEKRGIKPPSSPPRKPVAPVGVAGTQPAAGVSATPTGTSPPANSPDGPPSEVVAPANTGALATSPPGQEAPAVDQAQEANQAEPQGNQAATGSGSRASGQLGSQACVVSVFGQCLVFQGGEQNSPASGANFLGGKVSRSTNAGRPVARTGEPAAQPSTTRSNTAPAKPVRIAQATSPSAGGGNKAKDGLLFPSEEELRRLGARANEIGNPGKPVGPVPTAAPLSAAPATSGPAIAAPAANAPPSASAPVPAPASTIESDVAPEVWAEYGGWYQQDYTVFYRPKGHKDRFIYSWLVVAGTQTSQRGNRLATEVFETLTGKEAQGACTKCHSVDTDPATGRLVNFFPERAETKRGRFTNFVHEPHFGIMDNRGCLTCHELQSSPAFLKSYEQGNPRRFVSNFGSVKKELCQSCHAAGKSRQDCLLCHSYHITGVVTPTINTEIPSKR